MEIVDKALGPIELQVSFSGGNLVLSATLSEKQLLDAGIKLLPVSVQPVADAIEAVAIEAGAAVK